MKKMMYMVVALVCAALAAPVMADPDKDESGHGKHHKRKHRETEVIVVREQPADVVVVQQQPSEIRLEAPSIVITPPRIVVQ